ncbi:amidohydrolase [Epibacterium ulvae]|uniref:M20 aminoacylase family protein n=1 Tax=Epibacterium ulvae TaxID=1156985 RepID=UPI001BFCB55F|nr:M20 aminoacylase family protein [Epibacterium ulvae]MBT8155227.1 amidohydrolase [Epibacterium ulvae]
MPIVNRIADYAGEMRTWRQHLHTIPELALDLPKTSAYVKEQLQAIGVDELHEGFATCGMIAIINGQGAGETIGLRADMDALPIPEETGVDYSSTHAGNMHACGHDGHTTMLLGAAKYLTETRNFKGRVALIFQPAEEAIGGAEIMINEGVLETFDISQVYALHTAPGFPEGQIVTTPGPIMAAVDEFHINIQGLGGHGALPHETQDPVVAACGIAQAIQTIVSRNHFALDDLVVSVTQIHTGSADNVIPDTAYINGTVRTFDKEVQAMVIRRLEEIVKGHSVSYNVDAVLNYEVGYPPTINNHDKAAFAADVAREVVGDAMVIDDYERQMGGEDFSFFLEKRPGCYLFVGQGEGPSVHHPKFNFNDEISPVGASFFARLVERLQPVG